MTQSFTLAIVGSSFGLDGFVKIRSLSGETSHLSSLKSVILRQHGKEKQYNIEEIMPSNDISWIYMKFHGINSPEQAKTLTGAEIIADRAFAAPLNEGEYYIEDLKGLKLVDSDIPSNEEFLGHIIDVIEGGNGFVAEIRLNSGETRFIPFRKEFLGEINIQEGRVKLLEKWILE